MNPIKQAAQIVGSQRQLAKIIGVTPSAVNQWISAGVPVEHCPRIERATNGLVRCEAMRPEVDWGYLRATNCPTTETTQEAA